MGWRDGCGRFLEEFECGLGLLGLWQNDSDAGRGGGYCRCGRRCRRCPWIARPALDHRSRSTSAAGKVRCGEVAAFSARDGCDSAAFAIASFDAGIICSAHVPTLREPHGRPPRNDAPDEDKPRERVA